MVSGAARTSLAVPPQNEPAGSSAPVAESSLAEHLRAACSQASLPTLRWPEWADLRSQVTDFYRARSFQAAWTNDRRPTRQALKIVSLLEDAATSGLRAEDYDGDRWSERVAHLQQGGDGETTADFDLALTVNAMRFARDLHGGRVDPRRLGLPLDWPRKSIDLAALAEELATSPDPAARIESVEPRMAVYPRLKRALGKYLLLAREGGVSDLPAADVVRPGDRYPGVDALAGLLTRLGDLSSADLPPPAAEVYEGAVVEAVRRFQRRHGLESDGKVGRLTFAELRTPLSHRARQIELALERLRWVPTGPDRAPIVVNIPEFVLRALDEQGRVAFSTKVVVGKAFRTQTPVFADLLQSVVFRPAWNVPASITRNELVPMIARHPDYLSREDLEIVGAPSQDPTPETLEGLRRGRFQLRQRPGPDNSLGLIKFDFPNQYNVYMHGTPGTAAFGRPRRDLSHGCIRLEDPVGLAVWVLRRSPRWSEQEIRGAMEGDQDERAVPVTPPIPVYIVYVTAVVPEDGDVRFFADLYGHDARLEQALAASYPALSAR